MKEMPHFKIGDPVEWSSTSNGSKRSKAGFVVEVVPRMRYPSQQWRDGRPMYGPFRGSGDPVAGRRYHESYIVEVRLSKRGKPRYYWPRVSTLRSVVTQ